VNSSPAWQHVQSFVLTGSCFLVSTYIREVGFDFFQPFFWKAVSKPPMQVAGTAMTQSDRTWNPQAVGAAVLIPAHNASSTIGSTLEALQCNPELDLIKAVIVLDDASSDGTADLAKAAWQSSVPMEVWTNGRNEGQWKTTNAGLMRLSAQWVFILHADDLVKPNWISLYLNAMKFCPDDVATICSSYDTWDPESNQIDPGEECPGDPNVLVSGTRESIIDTLNRGCWWHISGCAIRTRAFHQVGGFQSDMPYSGDLEWLLRCLASGFSVLYIPRSTMLYRQHSRSVSSNSLRRGLDIEEKIRLFRTYQKRGYLSPNEYRRKLSSLIWRISRRVLARALRRDSIGLGCHARLLGRTLVRYLSDRC
jgi:GT2 family glycosyltransferase